MTAVLAATTHVSIGGLIFFLGFILLMHVAFGLVIWAWLADLRYLRLYKERRDPDLPRYEDYLASLLHPWRAFDIQLRHSDVLFERQADPVLADARRAVFRRWAVVFASFLGGFVILVFLLVLLR